MRLGALLRARWDLLVLAAVAWLPTFASHPGDVAADTKQFLYLDPGWLLGRTVSLWDESAGLGTVTHQNIGYLWPMGPWFWLCDQIGLPTWVAQRLWLGAIVFIAATGVRHLLRRFGLSSTGAVFVGSLAYALSPYQLAYLGRTSVLLLPWAGLPWLISLAVESGRSQRWRAPALFALAVVTIGAVNASSLVYVGFGPLLWFPFAIWVSRELTWQAARGAILRIAACSIPVNVWWMAGLRTQAAYGLPVLQLTESLETVAETTSAAELMRGLGYWYFYGKDGAQPWTASVRSYTQRLWLIIASFALPALAIAGGLLTRWRYRTYFVMLMLVGLVLSVGVHPYDDPSPFGAVIKQASLQGSAAFALRNSPRALPLLMLGLAGCLAIGLSALAARFPRSTSATSPHVDASRRPVMGIRTHVGIGAAAAGAMAVLVVACFPPLWTRDMVQPQLKRPENLPGYWTEAIADLDAAGSATRVLELPGQDFGAYRWGFSQDVITRGLMERNWAGRELIPFGSPTSADLLRALDHRVQEGIFDPDALAPVAQLMGAGDVLLRTDAQYERFRTPRPRLLWQQFSQPIKGVTLADTYGEPIPNVAIPSQPLLDEVEQSTPDGAPWPPPVARLSIDDATPIIRTAPATQPLILSGDGEGVVDAAEAGLLTRGQLLRYSAHLTASELDAAIASGADVIVTDTNRRRAQRWGTLRENFGYTERAGEEALVLDPKDTRLAMFPDATDDAYTVTELSGPVSSVQASDYGNPVSYTPEDRPTNALDGSLRTAWKTGAFDEVRGEYLRIELAAPVDLSALTVWQPQGFVDNRWITEMTVRFSDGSRESFVLQDVSRSDIGQRLAFAPRSVEWMELVVDDTNIPEWPSYPGTSPVGFAEVAGLAEDGPGVDETVRLPVDALSAPAAASTDHRLAIVMTRLRSNPAEPFRSDPEPRLDRTVTLPAGRDFTAVVDLRLDPRASDADLDTLLRNGDGTALVASSDRIAGQIGARGSSALDGDPTTAWIPGYADQRGRWLEITADAATTVDHLDLTVVADGRHSVPRRLLLHPDGVGPIEVVVPEIADQPTEGHTVSVRVDLPAPVTFTVLRVEIAEVRPNRTIEFYSETLVDLPVAIAELGLEELRVGSPADTVVLGAEVAVGGGSVAVFAETSGASLAAGGAAQGLVPLPYAAGSVRIADAWALPSPDGQLLVRAPQCSSVAPCDGAVELDGYLSLCDGVGDALTCPDVGAEGVTESPSGTEVSFVCNGETVTVRVEPGATACNVPLGAWTSLFTTAGQSVVVDRVVLLSDAGGGAAEVDPTTGAWAPAPVATTPSVTVTEDGLHSATVDVTGATEPFWLVFGQSDSDGWHATIEGDDLGRSQIVDGHANGWLIDPEGRSSLTVRIDWTPQGIVDRAVQLSAIAVLVLIAVAWRNPRRAGVVVTPGSAPLPSLRLAAGGRAPGRREVLGWTVVCGAIGGVFAGIAGAIVVGIAALVALAWRRGRWLSATVPWAVFGPVGALIAALQWRRHYRPGVEWPNSFAHAHQVVLVAVLVIVADVVSQWRRRSTR